jgi:hypothetical protein
MKTNLLIGSDELIEITSIIPVGGRDEKFALILELFRSLSSSFNSYRDMYDMLRLGPTKLFHCSLLVSSFTRCMGRSSGTLLFWVHYSFSVNIALKVLMILTARLENIKLFSVIAIIF